MAAVWFPARCAARHEECADVGYRKRDATSPARRRSRFLVNTVASHTPLRPRDHEPAEQKVELQLLHQLAFRADRVESLQKKRPQQLLRRDPGTPRARIQSLEIPRHLRQRRVRQRPDRPQRMALRNPCLQIHVAEQAAAALVRAPHDPLARSRSSRQRITPIPAAPGVFQQPARSAIRT